ncbi:MAG: hypothetical protein GX456_17695 [Verrucomicrobia bacterium]|nr:hypothetical protein [Verrucomicrobiota bacterium]
MRARLSEGPGASDEKVQTVYTETRRLSATAPARQGPRALPPMGWSVRQGRPSAHTTNNVSVPIRPYSISPLIPMGFYALPRMQ